MTANPAHQHPQQPMVEPLDQLTKREKQVAVLVALAQTDQQIANALFISVRTVRAHLDTVKEKLHLSNRTAICRWVLVSHYERNIDIFDNVL